MSGQERNVGRVSKPRHFKFSVIIPVYNVALYLRECLDSIFSQTYHEWECVCVDDGSTDGSGKILDEYKQKFDSGVGEETHTAEFIVIHQENAGVSAARNAALDVVTGEWIVFVDADDCIHPHLLEICHGVCVEEKPDVVMMSKESFFDERDVKVLDAESKVIDLERFMPYDIAEADFFQFIYSASLLKGMRFPLYVMGEDRLFLSWVLIRAAKLVRLRGVGYYYRQRMGSAVNSRMSWRKVRDDFYHSIRRMKALMLCDKHVDWHVYRHQIGLWLKMLGMRMG